MRRTSGTPAETLCYSGTFVAGSIDPLGEPRLRIGLSATYSVRSAMTGSTRVARRMGT